MPDRTQAAQQYRAGLELYKAGRYEDAISAFDRAIALGEAGYAVLDGKAAACGRVDAWREAGYHIAVKLCRQYGERSFKPWYRKANILLHMHAFAAAHRDTGRALALAPDAAARERIQQLRLRIASGAQAAHRRRLASAASDADAAAAAEAAQHAAARRRINFIHLLPADALVRVAEEACAADPGGALRLAGVCREWRALMLDNTRLWTRLVLGARRPADKVAVFAARAGRLGLRDVRLAPRMPAPLVQRACDALAPHLAGLRRLDLPGGAPAVHRLLRGRLEAIESLSADLDLVAGPHAFGCLHPDARGLRDVHLTRAVVCQRPPSGPPGDAGAAGAEDAAGAADDDFTWGGGSVAQLARVRELVLVASQLSVARGDLRELLRLMPEIERFELDGTAVRGLPGVARADAGPPRLALPRLHTFAMTTAATQPSPFDGLELAALRHLSLNSSHPNARPLAALAGPLRAILPQLESLDLGRVPLEFMPFVELLPHLTALRFLNVSFCDLGNDLLEALVVRDTDAAPLLPKLTALSIAGSTEMTAGPLRRMVLSRLPAALRPAPAPAPAPTKKRSVFAPTRAAPSPAAAPAPSPTPAPTPLSRAPPAPMRTDTLTWLCADHCTHPAMEPAVLDSLRARLRFLSAAAGAVDYERARGRGARPWDADWTAVCARGADGCALRPDPDGTWHVAHVCKRRRPEEDDEDDAPVRADKAAKAEPAGWRRHGAAAGGAPPGAAT